MLTVKTLASVFWVGEENLSDSFFVSRALDRLAFIDGCISSVGDVAIHIVDT
jgi:hypothetical protein